ncbi:CheR family methyltransferase [Dethiothermospora halolimnae]|uniref:CheR family methyltransferase n=1 Tax=Dethiothermospora halolimnae TaxID=3114390 RepID=UPI003CCBB6DF
MIRIKDSDLSMLVLFIKRYYGINLTKKKKLLVSRLKNYLIENNYDDFSVYSRDIIKDKNGKLTKDFLDMITTNHTYFMREFEHFKYFKKDILPHLKSTVKDKDLRIWSAGCSSGEEPYTLAILIDDYLKEDRENWDTKILATDISSKALSIAKGGIYKNEKLELIPDSWKRKYFKRISEKNSQVKEEIKKEIIFRKFNIMRTVYPFKRKFHIIFCRNVMIYFDIDTRKKLVRKLFDNTHKRGYLFIGQAESLNYSGSPYKYIMPGVYRKE